MNKENKVFFKPKTGKSPIDYSKSNTARVSGQIIINQQDQTNSATPKALETSQLTNEENQDVQPFLDDPTSAHDLQQENERQSQLQLPELYQSDNAYNTAALPRDSYANYKMGLTVIQEDGEEDTINESYFKPAPINNQRQQKNTSKTEQTKQKKHVNGALNNLTKVTSAFRNKTAFELNVKKGPIKSIIIEEIDEYLESDLSKQDNKKPKHHKKSFIPTPNQTKFSKNEEYSAGSIFHNSQDQEECNLKPINDQLKQLSNQITRETTPLYKMKQQAKLWSNKQNSFNCDLLMARIDRVNLNYTSLANAAKQIMNEDNNPKKLLGISQVVEKWMLDSYHIMQSQISSDLTTKMKLPGQESLNSMSQELIRHQTNVQRLNMEKYTLIAQREMLSQSGSSDTRNLSQNSRTQIEQQNSISSFHLCAAEISKENKKNKQQSRATSYTVKFQRDKSPVTPVKQQYKRIAQLQPLRPSQNCNKDADPETIPSDFSSSNSSPSLPSSPLKNRQTQHQTKGFSNPNDSFAVSSINASCLWGRQSTIDLDQSQLNSLKVKQKEVYKPSAPVNIFSKLRTPLDQSRHTNYSKSNLTHNPVQSKSFINNKSTLKLDTLIDKKQGQGKIHRILSPTANTHSYLSPQLNHQIPSTSSRKYQQPRVKSSSLNQSANETDAQDTSILSSALNSVLSFFSPRRN